MYVPGYFILGAGFFTSFAEDPPQEHEEEAAPWPVVTLPRSSSLVKVIAQVEYWRGSCSPACGGEKDQCFGALEAGSFWITTCILP